MPREKKEKDSTADSGLNFEAQLWAAADKMRGHMDASEYKHVCLGLIFLKYISDAFEEKREQLLFGFAVLRDALLRKLLSGELHVHTTSELAETSL
jgi:hypothetical protein